MSLLPVTTEALKLVRWSKYFNFCRQILIYIVIVLLRRYRYYIVFINDGSLVKP